MVNAAQIYQGARDGGTVGAAFATADAMVTNSLGRLGLPGMGALFYNAINGSQGLYEMSQLNDQLNLLNSMIAMCAAGF